MQNPLSRNIGIAVYEMLLTGITGWSLSEYVGFAFVFETWEKAGVSIPRTKYFRQKNGQDFTPFQENLELLMKCYMYCFLLFKISTVYCVKKTSLTITRLILESGKNYASFESQMVLWIMSNFNQIDCAVFVIKWVYH